MQLPETGLATAALVILCLVLVGGAATAYARLADKNTPIDIGLLHGRAGAFALILLILSITVATEPATAIKPVIALLILTLLGGATLYYVIRRKGILPISIILIHAAFAISAVYTLLFGMPF